MRLRRVPGAAARVQNHPLVIAEAQALALAGRWASCFAAPAPLHLEIGMGRGHFLLAAAAMHPERNYVGLERRAEPLQSALALLEEPFPANLRFLNTEAALLGEIFAPGELAAIYLHFPDPWPKSRHAKRRLTCEIFATQYQRILQPAGVLVFKTDGAAFYHWSCQSLAAAGWRALELSENYPPAADEPPSGYEQRFRRLGQPIFYAKFMPPALHVNSVF